MPDIFQAESVLKVGQRVEFFLNDDTERYLSRIESIDGQKLVVSMPIDSKMRPVIPMIGERLYCMAVGKGCRYRFFTIFRGKAMDTVPVWIVDMPETVEHHQNREFVRVPIDLAIKVRVMSEDGSFGPVMLTHSYDISGNGVAFIWEDPIKEGTTLSLEINNLPGIGTLQLISMSVRAMKLGENKETKYLIGARMMNLNRTIRNKLVKYIFDIQRVNLLKGIKVSSD